MSGSNGTSATVTKVPTKSPERVLITGGAGFIGTNLADRLANLGNHVIIFDNLSRAGVEKNVGWLSSRHGGNLRIEVADVRDAARVRTAVQSVDKVFHLAAQVAVTSSLTDPRYDYEVNVGGTVNVLEAIRDAAASPSLVYTSTNKVYGNLSDLNLRKAKTRYEPATPGTSVAVGENFPLEFHSPYGCSKGAADQYVLDYARSFGIRATVFRMSCIYGPHQMGTEDQGWVAHFIRQALKEQVITICGDGLQVRDVLFVDDLVDAMLLAQKNISRISGQAFNIGGGSTNILSLIELLAEIETITRRRPTVKTADWRPGDQRYYVSDFRKFQSMTGWSPRLSAPEGIRRLHDWLTEEYPSYSHAQVGGEHAVFAR